MCSAGLCSGGGGGVASERASGVLWVGLRHAPFVVSAGFFKPELNEKPQQIAAWLDLVPLDHGCGQKGVGSEGSTAVWKAQLREIVEDDCPRRV